MIQDWKWQAGMRVISVGIAFAFAWFGPLKKEDRDDVLRFRYAY